MIVRHKGKQSEKYPLPGVGPQGSLLGVLSFIVEISDCGMDIPQQPDPNIANEDVASLPYPQPAVTNTEVRQKYVDDQVQGELLQLNADLVPTTDVLIGPRNFHDRNGLRNKEETLLQKRLDDIHRYTELHEMKVNSKKTKIMPFNFTRKMILNHIIALTVEN